MYLKDENKEKTDWEWPNLKTNKHILTKRLFNGKFSVGLGRYLLHF